MEDRYTNQRKNIDKQHLEENTGTGLGAACLSSQHSNAEKQEDQDFWPDRTTQSVSGQPGGS